MENKPEHPPVNFGKTGVLIINLGTPDSTNWLDIRKYLKEFLSDRRVIEVNPIIWQVILNVFILTFRPSKTAKAYKEIWMKDKNISPLLYYTQKQAEKLSNLISEKNLMIDYAMRYGNPSIKNKITTLVIRTLPNPIEKKFYSYSKTTPPFFTNDAIIFLIENNIEHLVVDTPSLDRMQDDGILGNHRIFWSKCSNPNSKVFHDSLGTITELAYIPNHVEDGFYFLNIQTPHFQCDAAPSRPILIKPN